MKKNNNLKVLKTDMNSEGVISIPGQSLQKNQGLIGENGKPIARTPEQLKAEEIKKSLERQKTVNQEFEDFLNKPIDSKADNFRFNTNQVLIEVFNHIEYSTMIDPRTDKPYANKVNFPLAKVLNAGPDSEYKKGQIIKLRDYDTTYIKNPHYDAWVNNPLNKGNLDKVGQAPPAYMDNFVAVFSKKVFNLDPLDVDVILENLDTYLLNDPNIECELSNTDIQVDISKFTNK